MYFSDLDPETGGPHKRKCLFYSICLWFPTPTLGQLFQVSLSFSKTLPWSMYNLRDSLQTSWSFNSLFQKRSRRWPSHVHGKLSASSSWRLQFEGPSLMKIQYRQPELHWGLSAFTMGEGGVWGTIPFRRTTSVSSCWGEEASFSSVIKPQMSCAYSQITSHKRFVMYSNSVGYVQKEDKNIAEAC